MKSSFKGARVEALELANMAPRDWPCLTMSDYQAHFPNTVDAAIFILPSLCVIPVIRRLSWYLSYLHGLTALFFGNIPISRLIDNQHGLSFQIPIVDHARIDHSLAMLNMVDLSKAPNRPQSTRKGLKSIILWLYSIKQNKQIQTLLQINSCTHNIYIVSNVKTDFPTSIRQIPCVDHPADLRDPCLPTVSTNCASGCNFITTRLLALPPEGLLSSRSCKEILVINLTRFFF
jgi:hypothetical protein